MSDLMGYFNKAGKPITADEFARLKWAADGKVSDYARIGRDEVNSVEVSTIWLGLNHAFMPDSPPLIFESMIFGGEHDGELQHYSTEGQALRGHRQAVNNLRRGRAPW